MITIKLAKSGKKWTWLLIIDGHVRARKLTAAASKQKVRKSARAMADALTATGATVRLDLGYSRGPYNKPRPVQFQCGHGIRVVRTA